MTDPSFYKPENHPYTEHPTYTGPGCCHCGQPREAHPQGERESPEKSPRPVMPGTLCSSFHLANGRKGGFNIRPRLAG